jgi:hypothetical protein
MALLFIALLAFAVSFLLQKKRNQFLLSLSVPVVCFVAFVLFDALVLPYRGGGASLWPIALMFGVPLILLGSLAGALVARRQNRNVQG